MGRLRDKVAIATAAAQGIGRAAVKRFAQEGATVYACDVQEDKIKQLKAEIGDSVIPVTLDVTDALAVREFATRVDQEQKTIDVLFNCVGHVPEGTIHECDDEQWYRAININTKVCSQYVQSIHSKNGRQKPGRGQMYREHGFCSIKRACYRESIPVYGNQRCSYRFDQITSTRSCPTWFSD